MKSKARIRIKTYIGLLGANYSRRISLLLIMYHLIFSINIGKTPHKRAQIFFPDRVKQIYSPKNKLLVRKEAQGLAVAVLPAFSARGC